MIFLFICLIVLLFGSKPIWAVVKYLYELACSILAHFVEIFIILLLLSASIAMIVYAFNL